MTVYQGQLDLICCTLGVDTWLQRLTWDGMAGFRSAPRRPIYAHEDERETSPLLGADSLAAADASPKREEGDSGADRDRKADRRAVSGRDSERESLLEKAGERETHGGKVGGAAAASVASDEMREGSAHGRQTTAFVKRHRNLAMYVILGAGHMIPADQPRAALAMLARVIREEREGCRERPTARVAVQS